MQEDSSPGGIAGKLLAVLDATLFGDVDDRAGRQRKDGGRASGTWRRGDNHAVLRPLDRGHGRASRREIHAGL